MSWITNWSFKNKAAVLLITILTLIIGVVSYFKLPMEFLPSSDSSQIAIVTTGQGIDSKTMEEEVTNPIERAVTGIQSKSGVFSTTGDSFSRIDIVFETGSDMKQAKQEVQEALSNLALPQSISKPSITLLNTAMIPVSYVAVTFNDGITPENVEFAREELQPLFQDIQGVSSVQTFGLADSVVSVKIDEDKLTQENVPPQNVMNALQGQNTAIAIAENEIDGKTSNIKVIGDLTSIDKLKSLTVSPNVTLGQISTIKEQKNESIISHINGKDSLDFRIIKDSNSNTVTLSNEVESLIKEINSKYENLDATIYLSSAEMVQTSVSSMVKEVLLGVLFATIVIMIFLRNIQSTLITIVSIPLSLCITVFLLSISGITLNILTLGGIAVAVGRLVDDSIVVIENIYRRMQTEKISVPMVLESTKEVGTAITASTLTTVAVFLPISLMNGSLQDFILPFALTVTYSLLASLLVALTVVPLMSTKLLKNTKLPDHKPSKRFSKLVTWSLNHKLIVLTLSILLFIGSIGIYLVIPKGAVDNSSSDYLSTTLSYPNETPIDKVREDILELEKTIDGMEEVKYVLVQSGASDEAAQYGKIMSSTEATFNILLENKEDTDKVLKKIGKLEEKFPEASLETMAASLMSGGAATNITIDIVGENIENLETTANSIRDMVAEIDGVEKVTTNQDEKKTIYSLIVNPSKGNTEEIAQQLGIMLNRTTLGTMTLDEQQTPVILEPLVNPKSPEDIKNTKIVTQNGMVPVSDIATLKSEESSTTQFHKDGETYLQVTAEVDPARLSEIAGNINLAIYGDNQDNKAFNIPKDVEVFVGGASVEQEEDFSDLFLTMIISIGIVFLIMVITFKSFRTPIAILCSLPLAAIGAILGLVVSGIPVDITALLGALMLIGIVVTNAIVLLDRVKQNEQKMTVRDAIVEAATTRTRPIMMTAVATIFAMLPLLFQKAESGSLVSQSLAVVVIGGLAVATLLTLVVIPCIYELFYFKKSRKQQFSNTNSSDGRSI